MKNLRYFFALLIISPTLFFSCKKDKAPEPVPFDCADTISYSAIIEPLINQSCATSGCHNNSGAGGYIFGSHASVADNKEIILQSIRHESGVTPMPIGAAKLTPEQIQSFNCWIEQGALDN